mgnify:CR=1 FL=1|tara:strand:- start:29 stop:241 length:213 start_codon:yes stop_codon:yes gene_type:complete
MAIQTTIHKLDANNGICIVTLIDDGDYIYDYVDIGITSDGNTTPIEERLKTAVFKYRQQKQRNLDNPAID